MSECLGPHCSICKRGAVFIVDRAGIDDPLCDKHFDIHFARLVSSTGKDPIFRRCTNKCVCTAKEIYSARAAAEGPAVKKCKCGCGLDIPVSPFTYARGHGPSRSGTPAPKKQPLAALPEAIPLPTPAPAEYVVPAIQEMGSVVVSVNLSESALTRWWVSLSVQDKATVFMTCFGE